VFAPDNAVFDQKGQGLPKSSQCNAVAAGQGGFRWKHVAWLPLAIENPLAQSGRQRPVAALTQERGNL
jgi:hypothetical protein